jgi:hypothetical protein
MHFNAKGRNWFKDLPKSPLIHCVTPNLQRNKRYILQPCTLEAFQHSLPGSKIEPSGPADYIEIPRQLVKTEECKRELQYGIAAATKVIDIINYATEHYMDEPRINEDTRGVLTNLETSAVAILNWLNQVKLDPRYNADDTAYAMFVMEED